MKKRKIQVVGSTDEAGKFFIYGMDEVNDFFKQFPNHRIIGEFNVFSEGTSESMIGLYYQYIVPEFQQAYVKLGERYTKEQVDEKLREMCVITKHEFNNKGKWEHEIIKVEDLNNYELVEFLDELKQIGAEHFSLIIYDSRT